MDRFEGMATFVKVAETGSLSAAARLLGLSLATVSRQMTALEAHLGVRLLSRTTRRLALTEGGRSYYEKAKQILSAVDDAELTLSQHQAVPSGQLIMSVPVLFGRMFVSPALPGFLGRYPRVSIDLTVVDRYVNLVEEGVDVAIRIGRLTDSSLVARRLGAFRRVICASPDYLARRGNPQTPADLQDHDCLAFSMLSDATEWRLRRDGAELAIRVDGRLRANNADAVLQAALGGAGLTLAPAWQVKDYVAAGRLQTVLESFEPPPMPIHVLFPHATLLSAKVRAFVDYLVELWNGYDFGRLEPPAALQASRKDDPAPRSASPQGGR